MSLSYILKYGYSNKARDYLNLELRHHQVLLFILFILTVLLVYGCKVTHFLLICKLFGTFFYDLKQKNKNFAFFLVISEIMSTFAHYYIYYGR